MSGPDCDNGRADQLTERYRAASARDPARPSDSLRRSIFAYARSVAAEHATRAVATGRTRRRAADVSRWRISAAASVIVAGLATVLAWHFLPPAPGPARQSTPLPSDIARRDGLAAGSTVPGPPAESATTAQRANTAPARNAVTTRSRPRAVAAAEVPRHDAAAELDTEGRAEAQAPTRVAGARAAQNSTAQVAPSAAAAPATVDARERSTLSAATAPHTSTAPDSLLVAAESGNLERVDMLLRLGISTEQADARGRTALLVATRRGDLPMVRRLLAAGARADVVDEDGDTPLAAARRQGLPELARLLEEALHR